MRQQKPSVAVRNKNAMGRKQHLHHAKIDSAALLSRAAAGVVHKTAVFCLPGSLDACKLACNELIFNEMKHIAAHLVQ
jgi:molybdenum cofactor biosynthesis protein B